MISTKHFSIKKFIIVYCFFFLSLFAFAQNEELSDDEFFADESIVTDEKEVKTDISLTSLKVESSRFTFGGYISSGLYIPVRWYDPYTKKENYKDYVSHPDSRLGVRLGSDLFFNVRPKENTRFYGKFKFAYPFTKTLTGSIYNNSIKKYVSEYKAIIPNVSYFKVFELYSDFQIKDTAFFRFGKHTVKWGSGYFYSPADVINLTAVNYLEENYQQEGPVSLRTYFLFPKSPHTLWTYIIPDLKGDIKKTAFAAKAEFLAKNWELGAGGFYKYKTAPRLVFTFKGNITAAVPVFGEAVFTWGSDYTYHKTDQGFSTYTEENKPFFQATAGASYYLNKTYTGFTFQYYYNGLGYGITNLQKLLKEGDRENAAASRIHKNLASMHRDRMGMHYIAFSINQNRIGTYKIFANLYTEFSISELTGYTSLTFSYKPVSDLIFSVTPKFSYPLNSTARLDSFAGFDVSIKLGGGSF